MKVTLLGGTGFIGSNLIRRLNTIEWIQARSYSRHLPSSDQGVLPSQCIIGDFLDKDRLLQAIIESDVVVHMISSTVPAIAERNPKYDIETNLCPSIDLFELIPHSSVKKVIFLSSGGTVYGNPQSLPVSETHPLNPIGPYGIVKVSVEHFLQYYARKYGFEYTIARISNPYGTGQRIDGLQGVISAFLYKAIRDEPLQIWGGGNTVRDNIYVDDLTECLVKMICCREISGVYNVGSGEGRSIIEIINSIQRVTGLNPLVTYTPSVTGTVASTFLDISRRQPDRRPAVADQREQREVPRNVLDRDRQARP